jgi:hypothetical protein
LLLITVYDRVQQRSSPDARQQENSSMNIARSLFLAAFVSVACGGAAFAREAVFTVKLEAPVAQQTRIIALNAVWDCAGDTCRARPSHGANVRSCRQFVREAGARVQSYGPAGGELSADEIARCNGESRVAQQARN